MLATLSLKNFYTMRLVKNKKDKKVLDYLKKNLSDKYEIFYKHLLFERGSEYNIHVDFLISLKSEYESSFSITDQSIGYYIMFLNRDSISSVRDNFLISSMFQNFLIIYDDIDIKEKLDILITGLNGIVNNEGSKFSALQRFEMLTNSLSGAEMDTLYEKVLNTFQSFINIEVETFGSSMILESLAGENWEFEEDAESEDDLEEF